MELQQKYGRDIPVTVLVGSIRDKKRLDEVFETYHPTVVFHAAVATTSASRKPSAGSVVRWKALP